MDFKALDFKTFNEMADLEQIPTDNVEIYPTKTGYESIFNIGNDRIKVIFNRYDMYANHYYNGISHSIQLAPREESFEIAFTKNGNIDQSFQGNAFVIYTRVFAVIKKFIQTYNPKGLYFYGSNSGMDVLYDKFYKKYLSNLFVRVDYHKYVSKTHYNSFTPEIKEYLSSYTQRHSPQKYVDFARTSKMDLLKTRRDQLAST